MILITQPKEIISLDRKGNVKAILDNQEYDYLEEEVIEKFEDKQNENIGKLRNM